MTALDRQIEYLMDLQDSAKQRFGNDLSSCMVQKMFKDGYQGLVELKDGRKFTTRVIWKSPKFTVCNWKQVK